MEIFSKVDADDLLNLISASDCVSYFGAEKLISEMDPREALASINAGDIIDYLKEICKEN